MKFIILITKAKRCVNMLMISELIKKLEEVDKMDLVENSKQFEFLMNIKDVGMQIIFRKANPDMILEKFAEFNEFFEDNSTKTAYINSLQKIYQGIDKGTCSPDDLLMELGQYTPLIIFDDEEDEEQMTLFDDDDSWLYK